MFKKLILIFVLFLLFVPIVYAAHSTHAGYLFYDDCYTDNIGNSISLGDKISDHNWTYGTGGDDATYVLRNGKRMINFTRVVDTNMVYKLEDINSRNISIVIPFQLIEIVNADQLRFVVNIYNHSWATTDFIQMRFYHGYIQIDSGGACGCNGHTIGTYSEGDMIVYRIYLNDSILRVYQNETELGNCIDTCGKYGVEYITILGKRKRAYLYNVTVFNGISHPVITPPDTTPPEITFYNMTSDGGEGCINWNTNKQNPCDTTDSTPTVKINLSESSFCAISTLDLNYTDMIANDSLTNCDGPGTNLTCTLPETQKFTTYGSVNISIGCMDVNGNENKTSTSGRLLLNVINVAPTHSTPLLTSSLGTNFTNENLTCYNQRTFDANNDEVTNIYNWYKNNQALTVLNMPFEINAKDYSGYGNDGTVVGATWNQMGGKIGGAYEFDGSDDYIKVTKNFGTSFNAFSAEAWVNLKNTGTQYRYIFERDDTHFYIAISTDRRIRFRHVDLSHGDTETEPNAIEFNEWTHIAAVYNGIKTYIYINGQLEKEQTDTGTISFSATKPLYVGSSQYAPSYPDRTWNGFIDEVKIYNRALSAEQIYQNHLDTKDGFTSSRTIVSQETTPGEEYICSITPNDGYDDGETLNSSSLLVVWSITFNVTSGEDGSEIDNLDSISCNYIGFSWDNDPTNPYRPYGFPPGDWQCIFIKTPDYFDKTQTFTADDDKIVNVTMSEAGKLTLEEHTWLEALYNCIILKDCDLYNLLLQINQTAGNIWEHTKPTDESVVASEVITNKVVNSTNNLTINYTINIPIKAGYSLGAYLPVRIGYWFLDVTNTTCYNQGDRPTGVADPYCQPLVIETIGPMGGSVLFTVELQPELPAGDYSIKRIIDVDPNDVWVNYGQETIGTVAVPEDSINFGINLIKTGEVLKTLISEPQPKQESMSTTGMIVKEIKEVEKKTIASDELSSLISVMKHMMGMMVMLFVVIAGLFVYLVIDKKR